MVEMSFGIRALGIEESIISNDEINVEASVENVHVDNPYYKENVPQFETLVSEGPENEIVKERVKYDHYVICYSDDDSEFDYDSGTGSETDNDVGGSDKEFTNDGFTDKSGMNNNHCCGTQNTGHCNGCGAQIICSELQNNTGCGIENNGCGDENHGSGIENNGNGIQKNGIEIQNNGTEIQNNGSEVQNNDSEIQNNDSGTKSNGTGIQNSSKVIEFANSNDSACSVHINVNENRSTNMTNNLSKKSGGIQSDINDVSIIDNKNDIHDQIKQDCDTIYSEATSLVPNHTTLHAKQNVKQKTAKQIDTFPCSYCPKSYQRKSALGKHLRYKHSISSLATMVNSGTSSQATSIDNGKTCPECFKILSNKQALSRHMLTHTLETRFHCAKCKKTFSTGGNMARHTREIHHENVENMNKLSFKCNECNKTFKQSGHLKRHQSMHKDVGDFPCHLCPKSYCARSLLKEHIRSHTGLFPYKCGDCGKGFQRRYFLTDHMKKKHLSKAEADKHYRCTICYQSMSCKSALNTHVMAMHTNYKKFQCTICTQRCSSAINLKVHMNKHLGNYLFCHLCKRMFLHKSLLTYHLKKAHYIKSSDQ